MNATHTAQAYGYTDPTTGALVVTSFLPPASPTLADCRHYVTHGCFPGGSRLYCPVTGDKLPKRR